MPDATDRFAGQTVTVGVLGGGARGGISGPFFFWREAFEKATGATLEIVELPFGDFLTSTVADFATGQNTYDVITHSRSYKEAKSPKWALEEIRRCSGTQFDPNLVNVFEHVYNELIEDGKEFKV